jgi:putative thioredoxin
MIDSNEIDFDEAVVARSHEVPVLVDFWAPWCGPCRVLGPVLEQLEQKSGTRFLLAKVNTDDNPALAQRHQIRGIPAVKLYRGGRVVGEFTGALGPADVLRFLDEHIPDAATEAALKAEALVNAGDYAGADAALAAAPQTGSSGSPRSLAVRARVALLRGRLPEARAAAENVPAIADEREVADAVLQAAALAEEGVAIGDLAPRLADARDADARYLAAGAALARAAFTEALDHLLEVVRLDRKLRDDGGRKALLALFQIAGVRSETSDDYRRKLANLL